MDRMTEVMDWLDGLTWDDWSDYHSDSEVRNIAQAALKLLKEQQEQIDRLIEENASNAEMADGLKELLKEQEADIIAMSRFLESHGWDSDSICGKNVEIVVMNGDDDDA